MNTFLRSQLLLWLAILTSSLMLAQDENQSYTGYSLYSNFLFHGEEEPIALGSDSLGGVIYVTSHFQMGYITPAITKVNAEGSFHEVGISRLYLNRKQEAETWINGEAGAEQVLNAGNVIDFAFGLRYEYAKLLVKAGKDDRLKCYLGPSVNPYYQRVWFRPSASLFYPYSWANKGVLLSLVPRIRYDIGRRLSLDANVPVDLVDFYRKSTWVNNPRIPLNERKDTKGYAKTFPNKVLVRIGVAIRISKDV